MLGWWYTRYVQKLAPFQLENILGNQVPYLMFSFVKGHSEQGSQIEAVLTKAEDIAFRAAIEKIQEKVSDRQSPIILICENGRRSAAVAYKLQKWCYANCYIVDGGVRRLMQYYRD